MAPKLSILTPAVWGRKDQADALAEKIRVQASAYPAGTVEHLVLFDNKTLSIGAKRQALADIATGDYIVFVDDDDDISDNYVGAIIGATNTGADVIVWKQRAIVNGEESIVEFSLKNQDEPFNPGGVTKRSAWHVNAWRRELVCGLDKCHFAHTNYGEDLAWCLQARRRVKTQASIDSILHTYRHDAKTTEAPAPK